MSVCQSVSLSTPTRCWCVGVWQLYDASKREVSTQAPFGAPRLSDGVLVIGFVVVWLFGCT